MFTVLAFLVGIALGIVFHTPLKFVAVHAWAKFRSWRANSTRQS